MIPVVSKSVNVVVVPAIPYVLSKSFEVYPVSIVVCSLDWFEFTVTLDNRLAVLGITSKSMVTFPYMLVTHSNANINPAVAVSLVQSSGFINLELT